MNRWLNLILVGVLIWAALAAEPVGAAVSVGITYQNDGAVLAFPEKVTFSVDLRSEAEIEEVVLEYGVERLTCGTVVAKAFPEFDPSEFVEAEWTWEMLQSGSLPPGAQIWWRWRVTDAEGDELLTDEQTITWLDDEHEWRAMSDGSIDLHWYRGADSFATELLEAAVGALASLAEDTGMEADGTIALYIYGSSDDLADAVYYEPGWTGGQAYASYNIVIIGIPPTSLEWGKSTVAHELTHVLEGRYTFSCLGDVPTWLSEGLAMYGEGGLEPHQEAALETAIADDTLFSVRALGGQFSEHREMATLSYAQSYSIVDFLLTEYGKENMLDLLGALRDGTAIDDALEAIYGFDSDGLEDAWRDKIGAQPRTPGEATPTPTPTPTVVPTYVPIAGIPLATLITSTPQPPTPTPPATITPTPSSLGGVGSVFGASGAAVLLAGAVLALAAVALAVVIVVIVRKRRRADNE